MRISDSQALCLPAACPSPKNGVKNEHFLDWRGINYVDGTPGGTRTPDLLLRRQLLYPTELLARMERVMGIEPTPTAWKAVVLAVILHPQLPDTISPKILSQVPVIVKVFLCTSGFFLVGPGIRVLFGRWFGPMRASAPTLALPRLAAAVRSSPLRGA